MKYIKKWKNKKVRIGLRKDRSDKNINKYR